MDNTLVFKISDENDFQNLIQHMVLETSIADLSGVDNNTINLLKDKFVAFDKNHLPKQRFFCNSL